jgi:hypothetical protein
VFVDGSVANGPGPLAQAGYAAQQLDPNGSIALAVFARILGHLPKASDMAEHLAALATSELADGPVEVVTDCPSAISYWDILVKRPLAGV